MYIIHAHITVKSDQREPFLKQAQMLIQQTKAEEGNISYQLYEDISQPDLFVMVEEWKDKEALQLHEDSDHFKAFIAKAKDLLAEPLQAKLFEATELKS